MSFKDKEMQQMLNLIQQMLLWDGNMYKCNGFV
jgi:hypothetical protein